MNPTTTPMTTASLATLTLGRSLVLQLAGALLLGAVMVWGVEFADAAVAHNAAHDVRHANGRPCH
jgi:cobalt transporter subunit CbtB